MVAVQPSLQLLQLHWLLPFLMVMLLTLQTTGSSVNSCMMVEIAGSSTKGTRKRKAKIQTMQA